MTCLKLWVIRNGRPEYRCRFDIDVIPDWLRKRVGVPPANDAETRLRRMKLGADTPMQEQRDRCIVAASLIWGWYTPHRHMEDLARAWDTCGVPDVGDWVRGEAASSDVTGCVLSVGHRVVRHDDVVCGPEWWDAVDDSHRYRVGCYRIRRGVYHRVVSMTVEIPVLLFPLPDVPPDMQWWYTKSGRDRFQKLRSEISADDSWTLGSLMPGAVVTDLARLRAAWEAVYVPDVLRALNDAQSVAEGVDAVSFTAVDPVDEFRLGGRFFDLGDLLVTSRSGVDSQWVDTPTLIRARVLNEMMLCPKLFVDPVRLRQEVRSASVWVVVQLSKRHQKFADLDGDHSGELDILACAVYRLLDMGLVHVRLGELFLHGDPAVKS